MHLNTCGCSFPIVAWVKVIFVTDYGDKKGELFMRKAPHVG